MSLAKFWMLQILDARMEFPCPSGIVIRCVIDYFFSYLQNVWNQLGKGNKQCWPYLLSVPILAYFLHTDTTFPQYIQISCDAVYKTLWAQYRLFLPNRSHRWAEEHYWFWFTWSNVKLNFGTLLEKHCGQSTGYSFCPITFKLLYVCCWLGEKRPYSFLVIGSNVVVNFDPLRGDAMLWVV